MKAKVISVAIIVCAVAAAAAFLFVHKRPPAASSGQASASAASTCATTEKKAEHQSAHGGCLNAIVFCENGHAEVKVEGDLMKLWFVGGGNDTLKAVRVPDKEIALTGVGARTITLKPVPDELAEEKIGDCSHFEGRADWLAGAAAFKLDGSVFFKGKEQPLKIEYPEGYDPD